MSVIHDGGALASTTAGFAEAQRGKPYVWGATGPDAFDCSGLVWAAYKYAHDHGIGFDPGARWTTYTIAVMGDSIPAGQQQPGDLVLPNPGHVGIYVGNGMMINAPDVGQQVREDHISSVWSVRRLADPTTTENIAALTFGVKTSNIGPALNDAWSHFTDPLQAVIDGLASVTAKINSILKAFDAIAKVAAWLSIGHNWLRIGEFGMGTVAVILGILEMRGKLA